MDDAANDTSFMPFNTMLTSTVHPRYTKQKQDSLIKMRGALYYNVFVIV